MEREGTVVCVSLPGSFLESRVCKAVEHLCNRDLGMLEYYAFAPRLRL